MAEESPGEAVTPVGAPGTDAAGVTAFDETDCGPAPTPLAAETLNVYVVPLVSATVAVVVGGDPVIVVGTWAALPTNGVIV
jgi:hypothetical protein